MSDSQTAATRIVDGWAPRTSRSVMSLFLSRLVKYTETIADDAAIITGRPKTKIIWPGD